MVFIKLTVSDGFSCLFALNKIECIKAEVEDNHKSLLWMQGDMDTPFRIRESLKEIKEKLEASSIQVEFI